MVKKLLIGVMVVLALCVGSFFIPAQQLNIKGVGRLSFETNITLSVGSETAYASPDLAFNPPSANSGGWTNPSNAHADGGGYASITSGTPSASETYYNYGFNLTGNTISQVRVRYDASSVQYSTTTDNAYPTSDQEINGTWTVTPASPTTRYDKIDDTNNDADYITCTALAGGTGYTYYGFTPFTVPSSATITNLTVYYRASQASASGGIAFRSAGAIARATSGNVTPALPAGWQVNDLFICRIVSRDNVNATMPSGWTAIDAGTNNGTGLRTTSFYRRAQSGDTNPTVTHTGGSRICAVIVAYSGVITTGEPVDVIGATSVNASSTTITFHASGITTTVNNDLVVELGGTSNRATCSNYTGTPTPTERVDGPNAANYPEIIMADFIQATAGSTGARSATLNTSLTSNGKLVSFKPQPATQVAAAIKVGGTLYGTTDPGVTPTTSFTTYSYAFAINPKTGAAWTVADINGTGANPLQEIGVYTNNTTPNLSVSGLYAVVNYTGYNQIRVDVSWDGGTNWSAQQVTNLTGTEATYWYDVTSATAWTPDKLSDANFRVRVDAYTLGVASEVRLDWIPVEVNYTLPGACWLSGWAKRVKLTIDHNDVSSPLTDFPVLVYLSTSSGRGHDDVTFVFDEIQNNANRFKIAVATRDCTQCYVEIEKWDQTNEQAWLWVRVPSISNLNDTDLYLYYDRSKADNTTYVGDPTSAPGQAVWSNGFAGVWHLHDTTGGSGAIKDSTSNAHHGTDNGSPTLGAVGKIDNAINFDGTDDYIQTTSGESKTAENITWEIWFKADSTTNPHHMLWEGPAAQNGWGEPGDANTHEMHLTIGRYDTSNLLDFFYGYEYTTGDFGPAVEIQTAFSDTTSFHYAVAVLTGAGSSPSGTMYLDGSSVGTDTGTETDRSPWDTDLLIGRCGANQRYFDGIGDEVRVSATTRDPAWIVASYESGRDDLIDYGPEEGANITNTPSSIDFGSVRENHSYWSNGTAPTFPLQDSQCYFTLTNLSSAPVDITIRATDFSGGGGWTLTGGIPGPNEAKLKAGRSGDIAESYMVSLNTGDQSFITGLGASASKKWELKLETGTFTDSVVKTSTITLTATIA